MQRLILVSTFIFFMLSGGKTLFETNEAYAGCCSCRSASYATHYMVSSTYLVSSCTPPGKKYNGKVCPYCAMPDSKTLRSDISSDNSLSDMRAIRELPFLTITQLDPTNRVLPLMREVECIRRSVEMRLLSSVGDNIS